MQVFDVVSTRQFKARLADGGWVQYGAEKEGRRYTEALYFLCLGAFPDDQPPTVETIERLMNDHGWRKMTQQEFDEHVRAADT